MVANTPALVEVRNLRRNYGNQLAVKDVSFSFHCGEVLGLLGLKCTQGVVIMISDYKFNL